MVKVLVVLALAAVASAAPQYPAAFTPAVPPEEPLSAPAVAEIPRTENNDYQFSYSVSDPVTGDQKDQIENRDGPFVQGRYSLLEPDGLSRRVVEYSADDATGFNAVVRNEPPAAGIAPAVRAEPIAVQQTVAPVFHSSIQQPVGVPPAIQAQPVAYQRTVGVAPAFRAQSIAVQQPVAIAHAARAEPVAVQTHHVAYTPTTQISYQPIFRTQAYQPPPAVSSQTVSHTSHTVHPQPLIYKNELENVPVATTALRADHYIQTHVAPAIQTHDVAITPAVRAEPIAASHHLIAPSYTQTTHLNQYYKK